MQDKSSKKSLHGKNKKKPLKNQNLNMVSIIEPQHSSKSKQANIIFGKFKNNKQGGPEQKWLQQHIAVPCISQEQVKEIKSN